MHDTISEIQDKCALQRFEKFNLSSENRTPQFYILPKTHKTKNPHLPLSYHGRPICLHVDLLLKMRPLSMMVY